MSPAQSCAASFSAMDVLSLLAATGTEALAREALLYLHGSDMLQAQLTCSAWRDIVGNVVFGTSAGVSAVKRRLDVAMTRPEGRRKTLLAFDKKCLWPDWVDWDDRVIVIGSSPEDVTVIDRVTKRPASIDSDEARSALIPAKSLDELVARFERRTGDASRRQAILEHFPRAFRHSVEIVFAHSGRYVLVAANDEAGATVVVLDAHSLQEVCKRRLEERIIPERRTGFAFKYPLLAFNDDFGKKIYVWNIAQPGEPRAITVANIISPTTFGYPRFITLTKLYIQTSDSFSLYLYPLPEQYRMNVHDFRGDNPRCAVMRWAPSSLLLAVDDRMTAEYDGAEKQVVIVDYWMQTEA